MSCYLYRWSVWPLVCRVLLCLETVCPAMYTNDLCSLVCKIVLSCLKIHVQTVFLTLFLKCSLVLKL